jgi:hypothetical protein
MRTPAYQSEIVSWASERVIRNRGRSWDEQEYGQFSMTTRRVPDLGNLTVPDPYPSTSQFKIMATECLMLLMKN